MFLLCTLVSVSMTAAVVDRKSQCPNNSVRIPYVFELYFLFDGSAAEKPKSDEYQKGLDNLFSTFTREYPQSRFGIGSFIDKPFKSSQDYCYINHVSLTSTRTSIISAFSHVTRGPGQSESKSSIDGIFYSAIRSGTGWSDGDFTAEGKPIFRSIILTTNSKYRQPSLQLQNGLAQGNPKFANRNVADYDCRDEDYVGADHVFPILKTKKIHLIVLSGPDVITLFENLLAQFDSEGSKSGTVSLLSRDDADTFVEVTKRSLWNSVCKIQDEAPPYGWCSC